jgi:hypothetical protein
LRTVRNFAWRGAPLTTGSRTSIVINNQFNQPCTTCDGLAAKRC